jgi:propionyl-CoA carboxylase beta chain
MAKSRDDLEKKLTALETAAVAGAVKATGKQPDQGTLTARERVETLLDPGTFVEEFMLAETQCTDFGMAERKQPSDGVVTGFGNVDGRPVYVFSQDRSIMAGSVGSAHAEKIAGWAFL